MKKHSMALNRKRQVAALNPKRGNSYVYKKRVSQTFTLQETLSVKEQRRLPTLPRVCSTIGAGGLNCSVRNGKRWDPATIATLMTIMTNHNNKHEHKRFTTNRNKHAIYRGELKLRARKLIRAISSARL